jgi:hypothetical protein
MVIVRYDKVEYEEVSELDQYSKYKRIKSPIGNIVGGFITMLVGISIASKIADQL